MNRNNQDSPHRRRLSLGVEYVESNTDNETMETVKEAAQGMLLNDCQIGGNA